MAQYPRAGAPHDRAPPADANTPVVAHDVVVIGAGFSGINAGISLPGEGIEDFMILERANDAGGTCRDNTYPGCPCDVPSHLYSC